MKQVWNQKYSEHVFAYGKEPNKYFAQELKKLRPGNILLPGEGEGRNAIFAAQQGWNVTCFDTSTVARDKALAWAAAEKVKIDYRLKSYYEMDFNESYDMLGLFYLHMESNVRRDTHRKFLKYLKTGGYLIMEVFSKKQMDKSSGGPKVLDMLYSEDDLKEDFISLDFAYIGAEEIILNEGPLHQGPASVIRVLAQKF
ncbi:MAG: class I SAM-dependent methyltransferase [Bacteriovoracaceae bacterium]|nr:class I SAM-dependent methyltransferase [Bacteriovoracaceae bacterium]